METAFEIVLIAACSLSFVCYAFVGLVIILGCIGHNDSVYDRYHRS